MNAKLDPLLAMVDSFPQGFVWVCRGCRLKNETHKQRQTPYETTTSRMDWRKTSSTIYKVRQIFGESVIQQALLVRLPLHNSIFVLSTRRHSVLTVLLVRSSSMVPHALKHIQSAVSATADLD